jgi:hypothetical protein
MKQHLWSQSRVFDVEVRFLLKVEVAGGILRSPRHSPYFLFVISENLPEFVVFDKAGELIGSNLRFCDLFEARKSEKVRSSVLSLLEKKFCLAEQVHGMIVYRLIQLTELLLR